MQGCFKRPMVVCMLTATNSDWDLPCRLGRQLVLSVEVAIILGFYWLVVWCCLSRSCPVGVLAEFCNSIILVLFHYFVRFLFVLTCVCACVSIGKIKSTFQRIYGVKKLLNKYGIIIFVPSHFWIFFSVIFYISFPLTSCIFLPITFLYFFLSYFVWFSSHNVYVFFQSHPVLVYCSQ